MSQTYFGRVAVRGMAGTIEFSGTGSVVVGDAQMVSRSANVTDEMDVIELSDKHGEVVGAVASNRRRRLTVEFVPTANSATSPQEEALAQAQLVFPKSAAVAGSQTIAPWKVKLSSFGGDIDGDYNYFGGASIGVTSEGFTSYTMPLVKYAVGFLTPV